MESFVLTRKEMSSLLHAIEGSAVQKPLQVLQAAWTKSHSSAVEEGTALPAFLSTVLPPIVEKLIKGNERKGFSLQEIADLGRLIEHSNLSVSSMQNWVKRDFKSFFNCPKAGKKYSLNQVALLFIIDDLKSNLDFESIRRLFEIVFRKPEDETDDLVGPMALYDSYTSIFDELAEDVDNERIILETADRSAGHLVHLTASEREAIRNILIVGVISIRASYFHTMARRYSNATLFLGSR